MEAPKNLELQSATWLEYKHHNTLKFLVFVAADSVITFCQRHTLAGSEIKKLL